jgi:hypothetical protein
VCCARSAVPPMAWCICALTTIPLLRSPVSGPTVIDPLPPFHPLSLRRRFSRCYGH